MKYYKQSGNTIETIETSRPEEMHIELFGQKLLKADKPIQHYIDTGDIIQPENTKLIGNEFVCMTDLERCEAGIITLEQFKEIKKNEIKHEYETERTVKNAGMQSQTLKYKIDCRDTDILNIQSIVNLYKITGQAPNFYKTYDNERIPCDGDKFELVLSELISKQLEFWSKKDFLESEIDKAKTAKDADKTKW